MTWGDAWGGAWGAAWGDAWGALDEPAGRAMGGMTFRERRDRERQRVLAVEDAELLRIVDAMAQTLMMEI